MRRGFYGQLGLIQIGLKVSFTADATPQVAKFLASAKGRYLCFEALNATDGGRVAAAAEIEALDVIGQPLSNAAWKIIRTDNEDTANGPNDFYFNRTVVSQNARVYILAIFLYEN